MRVALMNGDYGFPTDNYVFDRMEENPPSYMRLHRRALDWLSINLKIEVGPGKAINSCSYADNFVYFCSKRLYVYVAGPPAALAALIVACAELGVKLTLLHSDGDGYREQLIF